MEVTESQLASAFEGFCLTVTNVSIGAAIGPEFVRAQVADADVTAEALFAALAWMAALREPVIDAHVCCEHVPDDCEVSAMADIVRLMGAEQPDAHAVIGALYQLNGPELARVLRWFLARFPAPSQLPF
jgi:hypothetical protein